MNDYIEILLKQFKQTIDTKNIDTKSEEFLSKFHSWIDNRKILDKQYLDLLKAKYITLHDLNTKIIETDKGYLDSVGKFNPGTKIVTPYDRGFETTHSDRIIKGSLKVIDSKPLIYHPHKLTMVGSGNIIMTQNPYDDENIEDWEKLSNSGNNDIILSVYGSLSDLDCESKICMLENLRDKLINYKTIYEEVGGAYYYILSSKSQKALGKRCQYLAYSLNNKV